MKAPQHLQGIIKKSAAGEALTAEEFDVYNRWKEQQALQQGLDRRAPIVKIQELMQSAIPSKRPASAHHVTGNVTTGVIRSSALVGTEDPDLDAYNK